MNTGYIAKYNGTPIYGVSSKQYIEMREKNEHDPNVIYAILDKENYFIQGNYVIGQAVDRFRKLRTISNGKGWKELLGVKENIQRNPYETEKAKSRVITERPTVESLSNEGARKLEEVSKATAKIMEEFNGSGETALAQVAEAGAAALETVAKETEEVVKKTTTRRSSTTRKKRSTSVVK